MMEITAIEPRRKSFSALYLDGEFAVKIDTETLLRSGYRLGQTITDEQLHQLIVDSDRRRAQERALYLLEHRSHSKGELVEKICRTTSAEAAEAAADRMEELGLIDDEEYGRRYAAELFRRKGYSSSRVVFELTKKGIDKDFAQAVAEELAPDPEETICAILEKKYPRCMEDEKEQRRAVAALKRLGYRWDDIKAALTAYGEEQEED
ncbi:MAG: regulatory protein RecX [Oscillospiraceae bacterium]|nr:regulatory protein RecX [Oscillospiraceae bacterium]